MYIHTALLHFIQYIDRYYNQWTKDNNSFQVFSNNKTFIELQEQRFDLWILTPLASNRVCIYIYTGL